MFHKAKSINPLNYFNESTKTVRTLSFLISFILITFVFATPSFAAGVETVKSKSNAYIQASPRRMQNSVEKALLVIKTMKESAQNEENKATLSNKLNRLLSDIQAEDIYAKQSFEDMLADIEKRGLPEVFKKRILKMQADYQKRKTELTGAMDALISEHTGNIFTKAYYALFGNSDAEDLNISKFENSSHQKFDPHNLPFQLQKAKPITPKTTKDDFILHGLINQPLPRYAALGDFDYSTLADASNSAYLEQSDEVNITQAIQDKAAELDYDAVQIYNYVRNNIEFVPTWGAVQSAELTLGAKRGNAMDISSLLIALLRASKIPARYVHGTIEVPVEKVKNWFGGWGNINNALTFAYSNGLPAMAITSAGQIETIRMEHIWIEVATDYFPSRGAKNHKADSWIPLDASYKQYEFEEGTDALSASGVDLNNTLQSFINSAYVNESAGYIQGMDSSIIEDMLAQAQTNLEANITTALTENNATLLETMGGKQIIQEVSDTLPSSLCGKLITIGARYAKLPSSLQQKVSYYLEPLTQEAAIDELYHGKKQITLPYARINNQKVTLSYAPATQADKDTLEAFLPEGNATDVSQLPNNLPSYIHVKPQLKLNGTLILEGNEMALGEKLNIDQAVYGVNVQSNGYKKHKSTAGDYLALGTVSQSISPAILKKLQNRMTEVKSILKSQNQTEIAKLTREDVTGNMHYATMLGYYAQLLGQTSMLQYTSRVHEIITGFGTFGSEVGISSRFGLATGIKAGGIGLDIPMTKVVVADNNNKQAFLNYRQQAGMIASSLEHQTPEQMYNTDPANPVQGISTMKAFALANAEGQKIYTIIKANINEVLPKIQASSLAKGDITSSVNAGKTVTIHEREVSVPGWRGTGYMVIDPVNGDGAYLISGGGNGGWLDWGYLKEIVGNILDIVKLFAGALFKRLTDLYDRIIDTINLINKCKKSIWQAISMLMQVVFLTTMVVTGLLLTLFTPWGRIIRTGILMGIGTLMTFVIGRITKKCQK